MKKILIALALVAGLATPAAADPGREQPDNWGQCVVWLLDLGFNPSEGILPPGQNEQSYGPGVVFWRDGIVGGELIAVHSPNGFTLGQACNYFDQQTVLSYSLDADGTHYVQVP